MPRSSSGTRRRIIDAALELFASQGFGSTTTKQIADLANANEATLFRNFKSKQDLLLAVIADSGAFERPPEALGASGVEIGSLSEAVSHYSRDRLRTLGELSELLRAFVGEAGRYSGEQRRTLSQAFVRGSQEVARHFATLIEREQLEMQVSPQQFAGLLDNLLFGYLISGLTDGFWHDREDFLDSLVKVYLHGAVLPGSQASLPAGSELSASPTDATSKPMALSIADLPADLVQKILKQAKKQGAQHYALVYLLFGAGLLPEEVVGLKKSNHVCTPNQHLLHVTRGATRQVPINQWIMGKRYGSYGNNPLSQWLKSRKDEEAALFLSDRGQSLSESELKTIWQEATAGLLAPDHRAPRIEQARQTWCVEMLVKGMNLEDLSILSGSTPEQLRPYGRRAREKVALERAIQLDRQPN